MCLLSQLVLLQLIRRCSCASSRNGITYFNAYDPDLLLFIVMSLVSVGDLMNCAVVKLFVVASYYCLYCAADWSHVDFCFRLLSFSLSCTFITTAVTAARTLLFLLVVQLSLHGRVARTRINTSSLVFPYLSVALNSSLTSCIVLVLDILSIRLLHDSYCILCNMTHIHTARYFWVRRVDFKSFLTLTVLDRAVVLFVRSGQCA